VFSILPLTYVHGNAVLRNTVLYEELEDTHNSFTWLYFTSLEILSSDPMMQGENNESGTFQI